MLGLEQGGRNCPSTGRARLSLLVVDTDAAGVEKTLIPTQISSPEKQYLLFFDDVAP